MTHATPTTMFRRLRLQLTLLYAGLTALLIIGISIALISWLNQQFTKAADAALYLRMTREIDEHDLPMPAALLGYYQLVTDDDGHSYDVNVDELSQYLPSETPLYVASAGSDPGNASIFVVNVNAEGLAMRDAKGIPPLPLNYPSLLAATNAGTNFDIRTVSDPKGNQFRILSYHTQQPDPVHYIQIGRSLQEYQLLQQQIIWGLLVIDMVMIGGIGVLSWLLSGRLVAPTERAYAQQQRFIAHASHEFRTPISIMRAAAELAKYEHPEQALLDDIIHETRHMEQTIDRLLTLAQTDHHVDPVPRYDLGPVITQTFQATTHAAHDHHWQLAMPTADPLWCESDPTYVTHIVRILLDNARAHTPAGSHIAVHLDTHHGRPRLRICDDGPGVPADAQARIFEAFVRHNSGTNHAGSGLGLSIAKAFCAAIDADVSYHPNQPQGACFVVLLRK